MIVHFPQLINIKDLFSIAWHHSALLSMICTILHTLTYALFLRTEGAVKFRRILKVLKIWTRLKGLYSKTAKGNLFIVHLCIIILEFYLIFKICQMSKK